MSQEINLNNRDTSFTSQVTNNENLQGKHFETQNVEKSVNLNEAKPVFGMEESKHSEHSKETDESEIEEALEVVSSFINNSLKDVAFSHDNSSGKTVIKVIDKETQELISQFPSEKILSMAEKIKNLHQEIEDISGLLVDSHV